MKLRGVAVFRMTAVSVISTMKVDRPRARLSDAPMRVKIRSTTGSSAIPPAQRPHLRQDRDQRRLPQISALAAHVRARDQRRSDPSSSFRYRSFGMNRPASSLRQLLNHRMPPGHDPHLAVESENCGRAYRLSAATCASAADTSSSATAAAVARIRCAYSAAFCRTSAKMRFSISRIFSSAARILRSYSFSSGVVNRSAFTSVCLRS